MSGEDDQSRDLPDRSRGKGRDRDISRYEAIWGLDSLHNEIERVVHNMQLVNRQEAIRFRDEAVQRANEMVMRRWHNVSILVSANPDEPGKSEEEVREILAELRSYMKEVSFNKRLYYSIKDDYNEREARKGLPLRVMGFVLAIVTACAAAGATVISYLGFKH